MEQNWDPKGSWSESHIPLCQHQPKGKKTMDPRAIPFGMGLVISHGPTLTTGLRLLQFEVAKVTCQLNVSKVIRNLSIPMKQKLDKRNRNDSKESTYLGILPFGSLWCSLNKTTMGLCELLKSQIHWNKSLQAPLIMSLTIDNQLPDKEGSSKKD